MTSMSKKTVNRVPISGGEGGLTQFAHQLESAVTAPPLVGCVVWSHHNPLQPLGHNLSDSVYMEIIINHPYTNTRQGHLPRNFLPANLVNLPSRKRPGISVLPTINKYLIPAQYQHGFRREHSTTSDLLQLTTDIAVGFNQRKPPDRTVCVAVDLSAAFDIVCHNNLLSKSNRSQRPPATVRWISCYLRGRQAKTCFRRVKEGQRRRPAMFQTVTITDRSSQAGQLR